MTYSKLRPWLVVIILGVVIVILLTVLFVVPANAPANSGGETPATSTNNSAPAIVGIPDLITIYAPKSGDLVTSPLMASGTARGTFYFEASFPVHIFDSKGQELGVVPAEAQSDWMTTDFVPFKVTLVFKAPTTATGTLVFHNDNPSGDPAREKLFALPVRFK